MQELRVPQKLQSAVPQELQSATPNKAAPCLPKTQISPEGLLIAEEYLKWGNAKAVATELNLTQFEVADALKTREVKAYVDQMYLECGYRNRDNIASALDNVIALKLEEMDESEMGSTKDIADLLQIAHKMRMDELNAMAKLQAATPTTAVQNNITIDSGGLNYNTLLGKIMGSKP
jgi:hypothetical protein